jgi:hypothetical protein
MPQVPATQRRVHPRLAVTAGVRIWHELSCREFPARMVNVSRGGLLMSVPITAPVLEGHAVRLRGLADAAGELVPAGEDISAVVVRVDRSAAIRKGRVMVAVRFA